MENTIWTQLSQKKKTQMNKSNCRLCLNVSQVRGMGDRGMFGFICARMINYAFFNAE